MLSGHGACWVQMSTMLMSIMPGYRSLNAALRAYTDMEARADAGGGGVSVHGRSRQHAKKEGILRSIFFLRIVMSDQR